ENPEWDVMSRTAIIAFFGCFKQPTLSEMPGHVLEMTWKAVSGTCLGVFDTFHAENSTTVS
ncbi:hypothetical protein KI387_009812, partial [Taxus chinensis]